METPEDAEPGNMRPDPEAETLYPEAVWDWEPRLEVKITLVLLLAVFSETGDSTSRPRSESSVIESSGTSEKCCLKKSHPLSQTYTSVVRLSC